MHKLSCPPLNPPVKECVNSHTSCLNCVGKNSDQETLFHILGF